ncbi:MAG: UbiA family prenyltransferase [Planctomycetes bacterium]|nr:UbiA family prenyltransferase [Planctomycetota bacterium]
MLNVDGHSHDQADDSDPVDTPDRPAYLVVDLDGCLVSIDTLWESFFQGIIASPLRCLSVPLWLLRGKAYFKAQVSEIWQPDVTHFPYNPQVLDHIRARRAAGARTVLATAAHQSIARAVAEHVGLFDDVLCSDGQHNLSGSNKARAIDQYCNSERFEYMGDSAADLHVWPHAARCVAVDPARSVERKLRAINPRADVLRHPRPSRLAAMIRLLRPHQWVKNLLILAPLALAHKLTDPKLILLSLMTLVCFCLGASATYVYNDLADVETDRRHARKSRRPLAAGHIGSMHAAVVAAALLVFVMALAAWVDPKVLILLVVYVLVTTLYNISFKRKVFIDVLTLTGLYTLRLFAGCVATGIVISEWLLAFSVFFFLSLALTKRYTELDASQGKLLNTRRGYRIEDVPLVGNLGSTSGFIAVLVLALYVNSDAVAVYHEHSLLWFICPLMLYWIARVWFLAYRGELHDDPVVFAAKDRHTYIIGALCVLTFVLASTGFDWISRLF